MQSRKKQEFDSNEFRGKCGSKCQPSSVSYTILLLPLFDKEKVRCYNVQSWGQFARRMDRDEVDLKEKIWRKGASEVYGMIAGLGMMLLFNDVDAGDGVSGMLVILADGVSLLLGPITGTFMPPSNKPDIDDTQYTYGSKSNLSVDTNSGSNDFVSCDNSDKSLDSETTDFGSCVSSVQTSSLKTKDQLASASSSVDLKTLHKTDDQGPCNVTQSPSFSFKENVKTPRNLCNRNGSNNISLCKNKSFGSKKCFVCGSKFHLIPFFVDFYENQLKNV
ncbi:hypothetical protein Tco_0862337 [Tanacetum coccineum]